jgi:hypothetical protein
MSTILERVARSFGFMVMREIRVESSRPEKQNLVLALLGILSLVACSLSWLVWHNGWLAVGLLVLTGVIVKPLGDELDRYR